MDAYPKAQSKPVSSGKASGQVGDPFANFINSVVWPSTIWLPHTSWSKKGDFFSPWLLHYEGMRGCMGEVGDATVDQGSAGGLALPS